ncbi:MAG: hypothetical protein LBK82_14955, partial [Planctomycetaceae bacterium]|nr:hypothetical protein [Planctomycetaceae bacterium]
MSAQILLDTSPGLIQQDHTQSLTNPAEKRMIGNSSSSNPLFNNTNKNEIGNLDSLNSPLPSPFGGSATGRTNITLNDFSVGSASNIPLPSSYGAYSYGSSSWFRPGMTREEYVLRQAEEAKMREYNREEQESRLRRQLEVEKGIRKGIYSLFNESQNYLPKVLAEDSDPIDILSIPPIETPTLPKTSSSSNLPDSPKTLTSDELFEQELKTQRAAAEALENSERKQLELDALKKRENDRKRWLQQRAEAERGAKLFQLSPSLQLKDKMLKEGWCLL